MGYPSSVPGGAVCQSLNGCLLWNITMLNTKLPLEMSKQNFVTKLNHAPHLAWVCIRCPCQMGYPQPGPRGHHRSKSGGKFSPMGLGLG